MKCEFSETQFVFGIMTELANRCWTTKKGWKAPNFPTQRQEKNLGYDVKIKGAVRNLFFQFKVPEKKTTSKGKYWKKFGGPYYEFQIWPDDTTHQHNDLVTLANSDPHNKVYYCSPGFHTFKEFEENYSHKTIASKSIYVPCNALPKISGNEKHNISYALGTQRIYKMHSEEFSIEAFDIEGLAADIEKADSYENVHECLIHIAEMFSIDVRNINDDIKMYDEIANYLVMNKNLFMILLGECQ